MRGYGKQAHGPSWLTAIIIFVGLLLALQLFRGQGPAGRRLEEQFAARPPAAGSGRLVLPPLPSSVAGLARTAAARIGAGGSAVALTPVAQGANLRVDIARIKATAGGLRITGAATNIGAQPLPVSLAAFRFRDGSGTLYTPESDAGTTLEAGGRVPLDLVLPIKDPSQLILDVVLEGEPPLRMILLQTPNAPQ